MAYGSFLFGPSQEIPLVELESQLRKVVYGAIYLEDRINESGGQGMIESFMFLKIMPHNELERTVNFKHCWLRKFSSQDECIC